MSASLCALADVRNWDGLLAADNPVFIVPDARCTWAIGQAGIEFRARMRQQYVEPYTDPSTNAQDELVTSLVSELAASFAIAYGTQGNQDRADDLRLQFTTRLVDALSNKPGAMLFTMAQRGDIAPGMQTSIISTNPDDPGSDAPRVFSDQTLRHYPASVPDPMPGDGWV